MMLRLLLLVLLLANGVYFAWTHGMLRDYGMAPAQQNEPQRVAQQIKPEAARVLSAGELKKVEAQVQADLLPKECLQVGTFDEAQATSLRSALESTLPSGAWHLHSAQEPARWIVYMGKYATEQAQAKKRAELLKMEIKTEALNNPALEMGLSLGAFESQAAANAELARLTQRGIRTARVLQEREESTVFTLKLPALTEALKAQLEGIKPALEGKSLRRCG